MRWRLRNFFAMLAFISSPSGWCEGWELSGGKMWVCKDGLSVAPLLSPAYVEGTREWQKTSCVLPSPRALRAVRPKHWTRRFLVQGCLFQSLAQLLARSLLLTTLQPFLYPRQASCAGTHVHRSGVTCIWLHDKSNSNHPGESFLGDTVAPVQRKQGQHCSRNLRC